MPTTILATKLYTPPRRPEAIPRPHLVERLNEGLSRRLVLISAPAGFGKTTLLSEWIAQSPRPVAWLSLDAGDSDPSRFLVYLVASLQTMVERQSQARLAMERMLALLQSAQPPPAEAVLTALLNSMTAIQEDLAFVLDDYHLVDAKAVDDAVTFLVEHLPPRLHLVIATREDPRLPLARLRARGQLVELRAGDLRFSPTETTQFLNQAMGLDLTSEEIAALESRTEGWPAGLQLAALALKGPDSRQGQRDAGAFIASFSGSHHFVLDYLVEEVLHQQPAEVQTFLLNTSILDRLCGPLCDALLRGGDALRSGPLSSGQETLEYLVRANLFVVPLDGEQQWYRYHHLFAGFLRQRLHRSAGRVDGAPDKAVMVLHQRASTWYEHNGLDVEAFHHAVAANDIERAARLVEGKGMPLQFRGALVPVLDWLASLPPPVLDAHPALWVMYASVLSMTGQLAAVEPKLQAAEAALQGMEPNDEVRNLIGHIAAIRALLAAADYQADAIIAQSQRALEYLHPDNLAVRTATIWKLGIAYQLLGDRAAAAQAFREAIAVSQRSGNIIITIAATTGLGQVQEAEIEFHQAAQTYERVLHLVGDHLQPAAYDAHLGLARIQYEWNDLASAQQHGWQSLELARQVQYEERVAASEVFLARLALARGDLAGASRVLARAAEIVRQHEFVHQMPGLIAAQVQVLLRQNDPAAAARLVQEHDLPLSQARVLLAQGDPVAALTVLEPVRGQADARGWEDQKLKAAILQALAYQEHDDGDEALRRIGEALALAQRGGFVRTFVDESAPMARLLAAAAARGLMPSYPAKLLAVFEAESPGGAASGRSRSHPLVEPLSPREMEVLRLIAEGLSNQEIGGRLYLALDTVKGHCRIIFDKLGVRRRTEAVARARELGLL